MKEQLTIKEFCDTHGACADGREWALENCKTMLDAWMALKPEWLIWTATRPGVLTDREQRLLAWAWAADMESQAQWLRENTNPNFAAVAVDLLKQANLKAGDFVAIGCSGSNPGVNLAVYAACEVLDLRPLIINSIGSSWWGANDPDFTWLDMEAALERGEIIHFHSLAASMGGGRDQAQSLSDVGKKMLRDAAEFLVAGHGVDP
jgi:hypothetical protein